MLLNHHHVQYVHQLHLMKLKWYSYLDIDFTLTTGSLTIDFPDQLIIDPGKTLTNLSSNTLTNFGFIQIENRLVNSGTLVNNGAIFSSESTFSFLDNDGTLINSGAIVNFLALVVSNSGTIEMDGGSLSYGGSFTNTGTIDLAPGQISCTMMGCSFRNFGIINIGPTSSVVPEFGTWSNFGTGVINNEGSFGGFQEVSSSNGGTINNKPTGTFLFFDDFTNNGIFNNEGLISFSNIGFFEYVNFGTTNNLGTFNLGCTEVILANPISGNPVTLTCRPNFDDFGLGGTTFGTVNTAGDQILSILEEPAPDGIRIVTDAAGGPTPAQISFCGGVAEAFFPAASEVRGTCGSVTIEVIRGPVEFVFTGEDGTTVTITLNNDDDVTYDESQSGQITNNGLEEIFISVNGGVPFSVIGGETVIIGEISGKEVICHKGKNTISISSNAVDAHIAHGDDLGACEN